MWRDDANLLDILQSAREIRELIRGITQEEFDNSRLMQHAMIRLIQIIGEAARKISDDYKKQHPEIPWHEIIGMRHRLVHDYFNINLDIVWEVINERIVELIEFIEPLVPPDSSKEN